MICSVVPLINPEGHQVGMEGIFAPKSRLQSFRNIHDLSWSWREFPRRRSPFGPGGTLRQGLLAYCTNNMTTRVMTIPNWGVKTQVCETIVEDSLAWVLCGVIFVGHYVYLDISVRRRSWLTCQWKWGLPGLGGNLILSIIDWNAFPHSYYIGRVDNLAIR